MTVTVEIWLDALVQALFAYGGVSRKKAKEILAENAEEPQDVINNAWSFYGRGGGEPELGDAIAYHECRLTDDRDPVVITYERKRPRSKTERSTKQMPSDAELKQDESEELGATEIFNPDDEPEQEQEPEDLDGHGLAEGDVEPEEPTAEGDEPAAEQEKEEPNEKASALPVSMVTGVHQIRTAGKIKDISLSTLKMTIESYIKTEDLETLFAMIKNGWIVNIKLDYTERQTTFIPPKNEVEEEPETEKETEETPADETVEEEPKTEETTEEGEQEDDVADGPEGTEESQ